jgi:hypothetical protein
VRDGKKAAAAIHEYPIGEQHAGAPALQKAGVTGTL